MSAIQSLVVAQEMAENAPTVFNVHVSEFIEAIWVALRDPKVQIREHAVKALRSCLCVIEKRETRWRVQWSVSITGFAVFYLVLGVLPAS